jgi:hypothetical protein
MLAYEARPLRRNRSEGPAVSSEIHTIENPRGLLLSLI